MDDLTFSFCTMDFGPLRLIGKPTTVRQGGTAAKFVQQFREDGSNDALQSLAERVSPVGDIVLWMGEYDAQAKTFVEIAGVWAAPGRSAKAGCTVRELPRCTMGVCTITGKTRNLARGAHNRLVKLMQAAGYAPDYSFGYSMEYYSYEKYKQENERYEFSYYLPCKPVAQPAR